MTSPFDSKSKIAIRLDRAALCLVTFLACFGLKRADFSVYKKHEPRFVFFKLYLCCFL